MSTQVDTLGDQEDGKVLPKGQSASISLLRLGPASSHPPLWQHDLQVELWQDE